MAEATSPLPKRRRTDNSSVTLSPEQIVQSNVTVQHFLGQPQSRWMQGYVPSSRVDDPKNGGDTDASSRIPSRPNGYGLGQGRATSADTRPRPENESTRNRSSSSMETSGVARANWQPQRRTEGANEGPPTFPLVDYESPYTSNFFSAASNGSDSMDNPNNNNNNTLSAGHPGLPSPAPSDENMAYSPGSNLPNFPTTNTAGLGTQQNNRQRQHQHQHPPVPTLPSNGYATAQQQQLQASRAMSFGSNGTPAPWNYGPPGIGHQQGTAPSPARAMNASPMTQQRGASETNQFAPDVLKARIDAFQHFSLSENRTSGVDEGRLSLLRDAVWPYTDLFYLALSQVHALIEQQPSNLPEAIRSLPPASWRHLDSLLVANSSVSDNLVNWLADFPAPINTIYADHSVAGTYNANIIAVANFLRGLPSKWDELVKMCRQVQAPPLAQDLAIGLGLGSFILQTVVFRALTRMIYNGPDEMHILDHLEALHRHDQQTCSRGYIRPPAEKAKAYQAFKRVRDEWAKWLKERKEHEASERSLPPLSRTVFRQFSLADFSAELATFQGRAPAPPGPRPVPLTPQQARMLQQQQQRQRAIAYNERRLISGSGQIPNQSRVNSQPPPLPNMPQRQPSNGPLVQMPRQIYPPSPLLVFPHENDGHRSQPTEPNPTRSALHEAHLRSPVSVPLRVGDEMPQLYRYVCHYALSPARLENFPINILRFNVSDEAIANIPKTLASLSPGELPNRILSENSMTFRLRCCAMASSGFQTESEWVVADTNWPDQLYLELNGQMLETRRPLHHKKHLPIDLTDIVKPGENVIKVVINRMSTDKSAFDFAVAVEMVGVVAHSTLIRKMDSEQTISAAASLTSIQKALSGASGGTDDDDIAITSTSMTIKLFDPFSGSKIFSTPVRGAGCPHKDCFDLEIFLSQCKRDKPGLPTAVDCWRCPLCRGDVRPSMLVQDKWLVDVRKSLEAQGKLDTRAIIVEADGSWKPKPEERTGVRSASLEREERGMGVKRQKSNAGTPAPKKVIEVIELD